MKKDEFLKGLHVGKMVEEIARQKQVPDQKLIALFGRYHQNFESTQNETTFTEKNEAKCIQHFDMFSSTVTESFYVVDVQKHQFCYVQPNDIFLCGYSVEDALTMGYDFYSKIVYSEDFPLWKCMYKAIFQYLKEFEEQWNDIVYFSCTFRLFRKYSFHSSRPLPQMIYHRIKPVWENAELRYLICSLGSSTSKEAGNLRMYSKDRMTYEEYNFKSKRWKRKTIEALTERERAILMLAQQGKSAKEIAYNLHKGHNTIRNQLKTLFSKLDVHSLQDAINLASNHQMIYVHKQDAAQPEKPTVETSCKRKRITDDMMQRFQQYLDAGKSIRQAAKLEGVAERTIRYWIKKGVLINQIK